MSKEIYEVREAYVEVVTVRLVRWLEQQGVSITPRGETLLSDVIRFESAP